MWHRFLIRLLARITPRWIFDHRHEIEATRRQIEESRRERQEISVRLTNIDLIRQQRHT